MEATATIDTTTTNAATTTIQPDKVSKEKVVIVGSGPAAHTAAIYLARAELQPLLFEGDLAGGVAAGGQLTTTTEVENFPGFPEGIGGYEFTEKLRAQSTKFGTRIVTETVASVDLSSKPYKVTTENGRTVSTDSIVIATGATAKRLNVPGTTEDGGYWQRGVSACAVCDGALPMFRKKTLVVVGGGDSAVEEAMFLSKYATKVIIVHRRDDLNRASKIMKRRAENNPKIELLLNHVVERADGDGRTLQSLSVRNVVTNETKAIGAAGLFFAIGHEPNVSFLGDQLQLDDQRYIVTKADSTETSVSGVFAAGDVQDRRWRQAITAAASGCMAALEVESHLEQLQGQ